MTMPTSIFVKVYKKVIDGLIKEHDNWKVPVIVFTKGGYP